MDTIRKNWAIILLIVTWIGGGVAYYIHEQVDRGLLESRVFKTPEEKVKVITHVDGAPTPAQLQRAYILDSINKSTAIQFRSEQLKRDKYRDSIQILNADQLYQIKEELKKIKENGN